MAIIKNVTVILNLKATVNQCVPKTVLNKVRFVPDSHSLVYKKTLNEIYYLSNKTKVKINSYYRNILLEFNLFTFVKNWP